MSVVRSLFKADLSQIIAIEQGAHAVPWNEETFKTCFQAGFIGWVIEEANQIVGFIIISLHLQECHILNLCIARSHQHQGLGQQLLQHALKNAKQQGVEVAYLEVRRSNSRALALYKKEKFQLIATRKDYYPTVAGQEDALVFAKNLAEEDR